MNEQLFWQTIDAAWQDIPEANELRKIGLKTNEPELVFELSEILGSDIAAMLEQRLLRLDKESLVQFIHIMEAQLRLLDREELRACTSGSDEGFLYARAFIVGMGAAYYQLISAAPSKATPDAEAEIIGFIGYAAYRQRFGQELVR